MLTVVERFWAKVNKNGPVWNGTPCWVWRPPLTRKGYGVFWFNKRLELAHRYVYELMVGPIPDGLQIDHLCRNRACQNPAHMEVVTSGMNTLRGESPAIIQSRRNVCSQGHPFDLFNTFFTRSGWRRCRECYRERRKRNNWYRQRRVN